MKRIIAAALSVLVGAFGYTIVDKALEDRVATLESEVVELREEVSKYHPNYSSNTTTKRSTTNYFTAIYNTTYAATTRKPTTPHSYTQPQTIKINNNMVLDVDKRDKYLLWEYDSGNVIYVSPSHLAAPTHHSTNFKEHYLYLTSCSAHTQSVTHKEVLSYSYDENYSSYSTASLKTEATVTILFKGYTDPSLAGKSISFSSNPYSKNNLKIFRTDYNYEYHYYDLSLIERTDNTIQSDGSFMFQETYLSADLPTDCGYSWGILVDAVFF